MCGSLFLNTGAGPVVDPGDDELKLTRGEIDTMKKQATQQDEIRIKNHTLEIFL
jgi:hypothetical protein